MQRYAIHTIVTFGMILGAGCSTSEYPVSNQKNAIPRQFKHGGSLDTPDAVPPSILPKTYFAAAELFEHQGLINKAIVQYRKAAAVDHNFVAAYARLGVLLGRQGQHAQAAEALHRAVELAPDNPVLCNNLGFEYAMQRQWAQAEEYLRCSIDLQPAFARAHVNLGMVLARQGKFEEALASFRTVLPDSDAYYNLGLMFKARDRYQDAAYAFQNVLQIDPNFVAATTQLEQIEPRLALNTMLGPEMNFETWLAKWSRSTEAEVVEEPPATEPILAGMDHDGEVPEPVINEMIGQESTGVAEAESQAGLLSSADLADEEPQQGQLASHDHTMAATTFDDEADTDTDFASAMFGALSGMFQQGKTISKAEFVEEASGEEAPSTDEQMGAVEPAMESHAAQADDSGFIHDPSEDELFQEGEAVKETMASKVVAERQSRPKTFGDFNEQPAPIADGELSFEDDASRALSKAARAVHDARTEPESWQRHLQTLQQELEAVREEINCLDSERAFGPDQPGSSRFVPNAPPSFWPIDLSDYPFGQQYRFEAGDPLASPIDKDQKSKTKTTNEKQESTRKARSAPDAH